MISCQEVEVIIDKCRSLPPPHGNYLVTDYVTNLFLTVLDFQLRENIIKKAIAHYEANRWGKIRTFEHVKELLAHYPDDKPGNTSVAEYLWGYKYWNRVTLLRRLVAFLESIDVTSQEALRNWAKTSCFEKDFKGKVSGMDFAIYQRIITRQRSQTVKPDTHVRRFVENVIARSDFSDRELVDALEKVAKSLDLKAYGLDWRIWEFQRTR